MALNLTYIKKTVARDVAMNTIFMTVLYAEMNVVNRSR